MRHLFACLGLVYASAALCLGLEPSALALAQPRFGLEVCASVLLEVHVLVTFQGPVMHLVHLRKAFSISTVVSDIHYYYTIYWFYVSITFCFCRISIFPASVSICLASASGLLPLPRHRLVPSSRFKKSLLLAPDLRCD